MINANELRIGNFIQANGPIMEVKRCGECSVELYLHGSEADNWDEELENCTGIPLTRDILVACGFKEKPDDCFQIVHNGFLNGTDFTIGDDDIGIVQCEIKYLHQLQNLYFALTGKELQVKL